jgi:hypothetical protein
MTATRLATDILAAHRLTRLIVDDEITAGIRGRWLDRHDPATSRLGYLATCPWCAGFWVSVAVVAARTAAPRAWAPVADVLALSDAVGLLHTRAGGF